jgi:isochorismate pyruvate lyase
MTFTPTAPIVAQCESLDEVRIRIDQADRQLVALLAERAQYVQQAARFKRHPQEVQASQRVQQVLERALNQARDIGAPTAVVEATYRAMIAAFIEDESQRFEQLAAHA